MKDFSAQFDAGTYFGHSTLFAGTANTESLVVHVAAPTEKAALDAVHGVYGHLVSTRELSSKLTPPVIVQVHPSGPDEISVVAARLHYILGSIRILAILREEINGATTGVSVVAEDGERRRVIMMTSSSQFADANKYISPWAVYQEVLKHF
ncbi:hypothetical protein [Ancylobacter rudongensis]|uniref:Uncharacterized protein n=1 Tax=Ancylobacter rudongensis TaxID=177413 RepID=A0A1G4UQ60_9HYPH|nr:hypothetical protein [Ancylobacter rudongensis]SCW95801.1 hypothetical protein SAMN05660859_0122 [Ancylobacter rudongensis]